MTPPDDAQDPVQTPASTPAPLWKRPLFVGGVAVLVLLAAGIAAVAFYQRPLSARDPAGALACQQLADWQSGKVAENSFTVSVALGDQASKAATESIRKAAGDPVLDDKSMAALRDAGLKAGNMRFANLHELHTACAGEGADMPPWVDPPAVGDDGPGNGASAQPTPPSTRNATVGQPFDLPRWRVTVTGMKCGKAAPLMGVNVGDHTNVCIVYISYTNISSAAHLYGGTVDESMAGDAPEDTFVGFDLDGRQYAGTTWASDVVNPGLTGSNELDFDVAPGVTLAAVKIADVLVALG